MSSHKPHVSGAAFDARQRACLGALCLSLALLSTSAGAQTVSYQKGDGKGSVSENDDTHIKESAPDTNYSTETTFLIDESSHLHSLIKFPNIFGTGIDQIPPGSSIVSATLTLYVDNSATDCPIVYQLTQDWTEAEATWNSRRTSVGWAEPGADGSVSHKPTPQGVFPCSTADVFENMDVTTTVQNWSHGEMNEGWVFVNDNNSDGIDFASSEASTIAKRPKLTVTFVPAVFYSIGTNASDLKAGLPTVTIANSVGTLSIPQPNNVGVGDAVTYGGGNVAYISSRRSSTVYSLHTGAGGVPADVIGASVSSIRRAFNSLSAAQLGSPDALHLNTQDLVASNLQLSWACYNDDRLDDRLDLAGWTTGPQNFIRIFAPALPSEVGSSQRHTGVAGTGFRIRPIDAAVQGFDIILLRTPYVRIEGLEVDGSELRNAVYVRGVLVLNGLTNVGDIRMDSTLIHDLHTTQGTYVLEGSFGFLDYQDLASEGPPVRLTNNVIYDVTSSLQQHIGGIHIGSRATSYVYNNTVYHVQNAGLPGGPAWGIVAKAFGGGVVTVIASNNYSGDIVALNNPIARAFDTQSGGVLVQSSNVSSDATAAGPGSRVNQATYLAYFRSITAGGENLHLRQDSNDLWGAYGVDLANDPNAPIKDDIDNQPRRPAVPDIGADELDPATVLHRSVGTNGGDLNTGLRSVEISGSTATFSGAMPDNIGVGDVLEYQIFAVHYLAFIDARVSASAYSVSSSVGGAPQPAPPGTSVSVFRAYNSLSAWEMQSENVSLDATVRNFDTTTDLVGSNTVMLVAAYGDGVDTAAVVVDGWTTDPDRYIRIFTPFAATEVGASQRHAGRWDVTKYHLENGGTDVIRIADEFVRLDGLQVGLTADIGNATGISITGGVGASDYAVSNSIIRGNGVGVTDTRIGLNVFSAGSGVVRAWNNLIFDWAGGASNVAGVMPDDPDFTFYLYNNTVVDNTVGIDVPAGTVVAKNNLVYNNVDNYAGAFDASSTQNLSGPAQVDAPGSNSRNGAIVTFINVAADDFHLSPADAGARDLGADLSGDPDLSFADDIDLGSRSAPWDIGADEAGASAGTPTLSSASNQTFSVGSPPQAAVLFTITDTSLAPTITAVGELRIRIPAGPNMVWDSSVSSATVGGPDAANVDGSLVTYEDSDKTVVVNVVSDFEPGDQVTIAGLWFTSFTAPSAPASLELEVFNDDVVTAVDDKTIAIAPGALPNLSSDDSIVYSLGGAPAVVSPITITDGATAVIEDASDIRIRIPDGVAMTWDTSVVSITVSGTASGDVSNGVSYEDSDRTVVINVTNPAGFAPGTYIRVENLKFASFSAVSPPGFLELELDNLDTIADLDDQTVEIDGLGEVEVLTATATDQQVLLEWVNPLYGQYASTRILRKRDASGCPSGPFDGTAVVVYDNGAAGLAAKDSVIDPMPDFPTCPASLCNDVTYCYVAYVDDGIGGFSSGKPVKSRPFDTSGLVKWAYSTGASTMSPPGLGRHGSGRLAVYQASNDRVFHAIEAGAAGGMWPTGPDWTPFKMLAPAQHRPAVVDVAVGAASRVAYVGSQDGHVYAIDADTGTLVWKSPTLALGVQAAPAGIFTSAPYSRAYDLILVGSRNPGGPNAFYGLNLNDGSVAWTFDNGGAGLGMINGGAAMDYNNNRVCFASHEQTVGDDTIWCLSFSFSGSWTIVNEWSDAIGSVSGSPVLANGKLYVGTDGGTVHAFDAIAGTPLWNQPLGDGLVKGFVFPHFGTTELFVSTTSTIHCLDDATNGLPCVGPWPETGVGLPSPPLQAPFTTLLFAGSTDGHLYQLKTDNSILPLGILLGDGGSVVGAPTFDLLNNLVYVGTDAGIIYAVEPQP